MQNECPNLSLNHNHYSFHHLFAAGEEDEDEKPLKSVQHQEDVPLKTSRVTLTVISTLQHQRLEKRLSISPDRLNIQAPSQQAGCPAEAHQGGESQVKSETRLRPARRDLRRAVGRLPHQAGGVDEEKQVEGEDDGEGDDEVDHQRCSRPKPADANGGATKLGSVLARHLGNVKEVKEDGDGNEKCRCEPPVDQVAAKPTPLSS